MTIVHAAPGSAGRMVWAGELSVLLAALALAGCESGGGPALSARQWDAIETREVDAPREQVLRSAATVLLDAGFVYDMSDNAAGLMSGFRVANPIYSEHYARTGGMLGASGACPTCAADSSRRPLEVIDSTMVWVCSAGASRSLVRIQIWRSGRRIAEGPVRDEFWSFLEKRLLIDAPGAANPARNVTAPPPLPPVGAASPPGVRGARLTEANR